ncbi:hypothetical protein GCM10011368_11100 [Hyunsoonleella pacifica]|nr:hypothetical protein GCM10011368_11100 [Hyunsoonleella pacifica]
MLIAYYWQFLMRFILIRYLTVNTKLQLHFHEELLINSFHNALKFGNKKNIYIFVDDWSNIE